MNETTITSKKRIDWLDGIKGISCLFIFFHHFCFQYFPSTYWGTAEKSMANGFDTFLSQSPLGLIVNGNFFVHLFILISGYVITSVIISMKSQKTGIFIIKRYLKLLFPIAVYALIIFITRFVGYVGQEHFIKNICKEIYKTADSLLFGILIRGNDGYVGTHLWMMNYIFMGSIFVSIISSLCWIYDGKQIIKLNIFIIAILYLLPSQEKIHFASVFLGSTLFMINYYYDIKISKFFIPILIILGLFLGAFPTGVTPTNIYKYILIPFDKQNGFTKFISHSISAFLIILACSKSNTLQTFFSKKIFLFLSKISLWVFLLHGLIISFINNLFNVFLNYIHNYVFTVSIVFILDLFGIIIVSYLFNKFITPIGNKFINYIVNKLFIEKEVSNIKQE